jgi:hypothetical protein
MTVFLEYKLQIKPYKRLLELASQSKNGVLMYYDLGKEMIRLDFYTFNIPED